MPSLTHLHSLPARFPRDYGQRPPVPSAPIPPPNNPFTAPTHPSQTLQKYKDTEIQKYKNIKNTKKNKQTCKNTNILPHTLALTSSALPPPLRTAPLSITAGVDEPL